MKGFVEHVLVNSDEVLREVVRECLDVEVPYRAEDYAAWLKAEQGMTGAEAATELHALAELDRELFTIEEDFFRRLAETAEKGPETVDAIFGDYVRIVDNGWKMHEGRMLAFRLTRCPLGGRPWNAIAVF